MLDRGRYLNFRVTSPGFVLKRVLRQPTTDVSVYDDLDLSPDERSRTEAISRSAQTSFPNRSLLLLYGVMPRSGTNYVQALLERHPAFQHPRIPFYELPVLASEHYYDGPTRLISRIHKPSAEAFARLEWMAYTLSGLRNRLLSLADDGTITVVKSVPAHGIDLFPILFPLDRLIIIIRNGKHTVDSYQRTFARKRLSRTFEDICFEWNAAAQKALRLSKRADASVIKLVRYEDILADKAAAIAETLAWMGHEADMSVAADLDAIPILGSSTHSQAANGKVTWAPTAVRHDYRPADRAIKWTRAQEKSFLEICGATNRAAGYA